MNPYRFFDYASTSPCSEEALQTYLETSKEHFANPSSSHILGQKAARIIRDAREFFASQFQIEPAQVIFTGSGTEANNLALIGSTLPSLVEAPQKKAQLLFSAIEHASVRNTALSLKDFGVKVHPIPVNSQGEILEDVFEKQLSEGVSVVSIQTVNQLIGAHVPVEKWAALTKKLSPCAIFHTDAIQAFGRVPVPQAPSSQVDLMSLSAHKIRGPKGMGALIVLNRDLLKHKKLRPLIWGGGQEKGMRSGSQNPALIASFHRAAQTALAEQNASHRHVLHLSETFKKLLTEKTIPELQWNSPHTHAIPHILNLSFLGIPAAPLASVLEEKKCIISTGSACHSKKSDPDPVLAALGLSTETQNSAIRVSFSSQTQIKEVELLVEEIADSVTRLRLLLGKSLRQSPPNAKKNLNSKK